MLIVVIQQPINILFSINHATMKAKYNAKQIKNEAAGVRNRGKIGTTRTEVDEAKRQKFEQRRGSIRWNQRAATERRDKREFQAVEMQERRQTDRQTLSFLSQNARGKLRGWSTFGGNRPSVAIRKTKQHC